MRCMLVDFKSAILRLIILHYFCGKYVSITAEPNASLQPSEHRDWTLSLYYAFAVLRNSNFPNIREWIFWLKIWRKYEIVFLFYVLLTVHLSIFILVVNQLDAQNLFYNKFVSCLYMFRTPYSHPQEVKTLLYSLWYHHTYRWSSRARDHHTYRCNDARDCIIQFWHPDVEHMVLETCRGMK